MTIFLGIVDQPKV